MEKLIVNRDDSRIVFGIIGAFAGLVSSYMFVMTLALI